jgi:hypothetical protein
MNWLKRIIAAVLLLLVMAVVGLYLSLDHIVKSVVETQSSEQLNVPTTLGGVNLGLTSGSVGLNNFAIGSPAGFTAPQMFSVGNLNVDTGGILRLRNEPIHLSSITIDQPQLVIENKGQKLNFRELIDHLPKPPAKGQPAPAGQSQPTRLIIDTLSITNAHVQFQSDLPGLGKPIDIPLPTITMKNIGNADGADNGAAIKDVVVAVIDQMTAAASGSKGLPPEVTALLSGNLSDVQNKLINTGQKKADSELGGLLDKALGNKKK